MLTNRTLHESIVAMNSCSVTADVSVRKPGKKKNVQNYRNSIYGVKLNQHISFKSDNKITGHLLNALRSANL